MTIVVGDPSWMPSELPIGNGPLILPSPWKPMDVARFLVGVRYSTPDGVLTLRDWRGGWWSWCGSQWHKTEIDRVRTDAYRFTEHAYYEGKDDLIRWAPSRQKIANLLEALRAVVHTDISTAPALLDGLEGFGGTSATEYVACSNGLLHVPTHRLMPHSPLFFNQVAVPFAYRADAATPQRWMSFLTELWPDDSDAIETLQEFFGYVLSGRTSLHKILLLIGPPRSGKGTIARVLTALVGGGNHVGPTLAGLGTNFGLSPLIGKSLAIISDARLGSSGAKMVVERLLSLSGEDELTIDRKYQHPWTGILPTRLVVISNELPHLGDASGAIAHRFIVLALVQSWLGRENPNLTVELHEELPGILTWALEGLKRLDKRGHFMEPRSSIDAVVTLRDLVSPVAAFVRDRCEVRPVETPVDEVWGAWKLWAEDNYNKVGTKQSFGRDLRAVVPGLSVRRPRGGDARFRTYLGIALASRHDVSDRGPVRTETHRYVVDHYGPRSQTLWSEAGVEPVP